MPEKTVHELRWNPLINQWVIVAGHRGKRPWRPSGEELKCPFCPGSPETKKYGSWDVLVLPNKFPALTSNPPNPTHSFKGLLRARRALGVCEVLIETPKHEGDLCDLSLDHMVKVIEAFTREYVKLGNLKYVKYVAEFRNKGKEIGVSLTHPHSQIYALPFIPPRVKEEIRAFRKYAKKTGKCLVCDILKEEIREKSRVVYVNKHFIATLPYYAMWPYEVHIYPLRHVGSLAELKKEERLHLADILRVITATYNSLFNRDLPYIMVFHQKPTDGKLYKQYHMHVEFYQPYRERDKLKYAAGIEWGFWTFTYDGVPEEKAEELRKACSKALGKLDKYLGEIP